MPLMPKRVKHRKVQRGRIKGKATRGHFVAFGDFGLQCLEPGWITDLDGNPIMEAVDSPEYGGFFMLPFGGTRENGGHKGYGLGLVAEILAGALTGAGCSQPGKTRLEQGMLSIYIDPQKLQSGDAFAAEIRRYIDFVKTSRPSTPDGKVLIPGDIEEQTRAVRRQGLELDEATWKQLTDAAQACDVPQELVDAAVMSNND